MTKPMLGLALGGVLGIFDGLSALVSAPNDPAIKAGIVGIVFGSMFKGLIAGVLIGWFAKRTGSLDWRSRSGSQWASRWPSSSVCCRSWADSRPYYWQIMLPGGILGVIVGYATFTFRGSAPARSA